MKSAVFMDLDGTLIDEDGKPLKHVFKALGMLRWRGFELLMVSNRAPVYRGEVSQEEDKAAVDGLMVGLGLHGALGCNHHPSASAPERKKLCGCRKPEAGTLFFAEKEYDLDLSTSWMIGDRMSDIVAGARAGCRTIQVRTGAPLDAPHIETAVPFVDIEPDFICDDLLEAAKVIAREESNG